MGHGSKVYTIAPGQSFLDTLACAILEGRLGAVDGHVPDPLDLADITLLMPTRRAERALADAFLKASKQQAMLLPTIRPISDRDEEETLISQFSDSLTVCSDAQGTDELPPAIDPIDRVLLLSRLIMQWSQRMRDVAEQSEDVSPALLAGAQTPSQAMHMAKELARLIDLVEAEGQTLSGLESIVPDAFSEHWQITLKFLEIVTHYWPAQLEELQVLSPWNRKNQLIRSEAQRLLDFDTHNPVIVAGVTGSIPATVDHMRAVLTLKNGAIVLPGLDLDLDEDSWQQIVPDHPEHPQYTLKKLIDALGVARKDVAPLDGPQISSPLRARFVSEAMRPAKTTQKWLDFSVSAPREDVEACLRGVSLVTAPTPQDEAEAIALIMRDVANRPDETVALVTPDRMLARRVAIRLEAWGIHVDDSAGRPFAKTVPGTFLDLVINCVAGHFSPADVVALLKHPLCRIQLSARDIRFAARNLELIAFRKIYIGEGLDGIEAALEGPLDGNDETERQHHAVRRLHKDDFKRAHDLVDRLRTAFSPLLELFAYHSTRPMHELARAHLQCAEALCALPLDEQQQNDEPPAEEKSLLPLYDREAGAAAANFFAPLIDEKSPAPEISAQDYPDLFRTLIGTQTVREHTHAHPRLFILGPMEARLLSAETIILGSLNDGVWPGAMDPGPWLNRPMLKALSLPSPEENNGRKAHDFVSFLGAPRVIMTRAEKVGGVPAVPSRWLMRLQALISGFGLDDVLRPVSPWLYWARHRDGAGQVASAAKSRMKPRPCPPVASRPRRLSVSDVERLIANPYAVFAKHVLGLNQLPPLGQEPDAAFRGAVIHHVLARFSELHPKTLPEHPADVLLAISRDVLTEYSGHPRVAAFWLPRFARFAQWFGETEPDRRSDLKKLFWEISGALEFDAPGGPFILTARADRIDATRDGLIVTDYKTGSTPSDKNVLAGLRPQLPLEAAIAVAGGFPGVDDKNVRALRYISAPGGEPPGKEHLIKSSEVLALSQKTADGLKGLVSKFDDPKTPYAPARRAGFDYEYDNYAHLARVDEWSGGDTLDYEG